MGKTLLLETIGKGGFGFVCNLSTIYDNSANKSIEFVDPINKILNQENIKDKNGRDKYIVKIVFDEIDENEIKVLVRVGDIYKNHSLDYANIYKGEFTLVKDDITSFESVEFKMHSSKTIINFEIMHFIILEKLDFTLEQYMEDQFDKGTFKNLGQINTFCLNNILSPLMYQLNAMHINNLYHCDIKEQNIMMKKNTSGEHIAIFIDYGMSRQLLTTKDDIQRFGGTPGYISPSILHHMCNQNKPNSYLFDKFVSLPDKTLDYLHFHQMYTFKTYLDKNIESFTLNDMFKYNDYFAIGTTLLSIFNPRFGVPDLDDANTELVWSETAQMQKKLLMGKIFELSGTAYDESLINNVQLDRFKKIQKDLEDVNWLLKYRPQEKTLQKIQLLPLLGEISGGKKSAKIFILGRERCIYKKGRASFIRFKNELVSLTAARILDKRRMTKINTHIL
jgi:serine/threonine protein kinase